MTTQVARIVVLRKQLDSTHTGIWDLRSQLAEVTTTTNNTSADKEALHNQLDDAHTDIENLHGKLVASQAKAKEYAQKARGMRAENEELKANLKASCKELAAASTATYASDLKDSQVTINLLQAETIMLNIDIGGLKAENIELRAELATANATNCELKAQNEGQQTELKTTADDNAAYKAKLEQMAHKNTELCELYETALGEFKAHTDDLNTKIDTAADGRTAFKAKLERMSCEIAEFQDKFTIANTAANRVCAQKERIQTAAATNTTSDIQLKKMARENTELNDELATTNAAAGKQQTQNRELRAQNERLLANLETARAAATTATNDARAERKAHGEQLDGAQ
ncbi:hypothetical protein LPJ66_002674 [Kickxella alabastrina]|uniref:Uncharacterized protein n=1 Tax=Kickxella alabastrina TaxID=61397 RepID=A0ACC1IPV0_9FUNG|nr:hypothetical protein LPJ66_002674 [Kickxella alabastrina]